MIDPTITATANKSDVPSNNNDGGGRLKKKRKDENRMMVKNEAPHQELYMLPMETWAINFANKYINKRPICSG